jgi:homogentisate 1,2-dioxygenase
VSQTPENYKFRYQSGFGNEFASEAVPGALPVGQNSPQRPPLGLYSELISGTTFTAPRAYNRRSYVFRARPSTNPVPFEPLDSGSFKTPPLEIPPYPGALRWGPFEQVDLPKDFIEGLTTVCGNGSPQSQTGMAVHVYCANLSMTARAFSSADGEMLIIPQKGALRITTELGVIAAAPGEFVLLPKGLKFRVDLPDGTARGFVCENFGRPFVLPELGLMGSHGNANAIDFQVPVAAFEDGDRPTQIIHKYCGALWSAHLPHSPFDVVAWRGNYYPCKYDMRCFNTMGSLSWDHPDPAIFCALTSPSDEVMGANVDLLILPPRWVVADHSFRPPGFHRSAAAEFLGLIEGSHESRASGFPPGSMSLHNNWTAHGPDVGTVEAAQAADLKPQKIEDTLVFMLETRFPFQHSAAAMRAPNRQLDCAQGWAGFQRRLPA